MFRLPYTTAEREARMRTIHKFIVPSSPGIYKIPVKGFVEWLDAGVQDDNIVLWAKVMTQFDTVQECEVAVAWTGLEMPITFMPHLRTVQVGAYVCHIFASRNVI